MFKCERFLLTLSVCKISTELLLMSDKQTDSYNFTWKQWNLWLNLLLSVVWISPRCASWWHGVNAQNWSSVSLLLQFQFGRKVFLCVIECEVQMFTITGYNNVRSLHLCTKKRKKRANKPTQSWTLWNWKLHTIACVCCSELSLLLTEKSLHCQQHYYTLHLVTINVLYPMWDLFNLHFCCFSWMIIWARRSCFLKLFLSYYSKYW